MRAANATCIGSSAARRSAPRPDVALAGEVEGGSERLGWPAPVGHGGVACLRVAGRGTLGIGGDPGAGRPYRQRALKSARPPTPWIGTARRRGLKAQDRSLCGSTV